LVAYQNNIGVLWSNQNDNKMYFSFHRNGDPDTTWFGPLAIYAGSNFADDHINLKSFQADDSGRLFAAVKTSRTGSSDTLIHLLSRSAGGAWQSAVFGRGTDDHTRPLVLLDSSNNRVYMFATSPTSCGIIYMKSSSMDNLSFPTGKGEPFISSSTYTCINNATSTKQTLNASTGLVVLASDESQKYYLHNAIGLGGTPPADTTPPTVIGRAPAANATSVAPTASVQATFSEPVGGVSATSFTLTPAGGSAIAAAVTYDSASRTATLQPSASLAPGTSYTAALTSDIKDSANNPLAPVAWSFTTATSPPADTTPPTVVATNPASGAAGVPVAASVSATFSEPIDAGTVTAANVTLTGPGGAVGAVVAYDAASKTATLQPSASLAAGATYTAQISGVRDLAGNSIAAPYAWSFTTAAAPPSGTTYTFGPSADTYVSEASPSSSYTTSSSFTAVGGSGSAKQSFLRFTVSGLPAGVAVSSAKLRLYVTNDSTSGGIVQSVSTNTWPEALTWAGKPAIDGPALATLGAVGVNTFVEIDLGTAIAGNGSYSFAITLPASVTNTVGYASRENGTVGNRPQLIVTT
jgi:hypothetical protein